MKAWVPAVACALVLSVRVSVPGPPARDKESKPAGPALTGQVMAEESGKPLPGAIVEVFEHLDTEARRTRRLEGRFVDSPIARGVADATGRFRVEAPKDTRLIVTARAAGKAAARVGGVIELRQGGERDLGRLELARGRRLEGRVVSEGGVPVAGARVAAYAPRAPGASRGSGLLRLAGAGGGARLGEIGFSSFATTGRDGSFALESLPERAVTLRAYADGFAPAAIAEPRAGGRVTIQLATGHALAGQVVAPDGATPAAGAWVLAGEDGLDGVARCDAKGRFRFERLPAGARSLTATGGTITIVIPRSGPKVESASASAPAARVATAPAAPSWAASSPTKINLPTPAGTPEPKLRLRPGATVQARALDATTRAPVEGAVLALDEGGPPRVAVTGERGEAVFTGVPVGGVTLWSHAEGYLSDAAGPLTIKAGETREMTTALTAAAGIEGIVRDHSGRPVADARITVSAPPAMKLPVRLPLFFPLGDPVATDDQGRFTLESLPPQRPLKIAVHSQGFAPWEIADIRLRPGERRANLEALLDAGLIITGRILDAEKRPVAGAAVTASRHPEQGMGGMVIRLAGAGGGRRGRDASFGMVPGGDELPETQAGNEGTFRLHGAKPGIWALEVKARGFAPKSVAGLKLEESAKSLDAGDIVMEPGASLRGRVVDAAGQPIPYARGSARKELTPLGEVVTGADGSFSFDDLAPGAAVTVAFSAEGYGEVEKSGINAPADELTFTLPAASRVAGQVLDEETRRPIEDFSVAISRVRSVGSGGFMQMSIAPGPERDFHSEDGAFLIEGVAPGKIEAVVRAPGYKNTSQKDVEVPEGKDLEGLVFTLDRAASVSGLVLDDKGLPLAGVAVAKAEAASSSRMMIRAPGMEGSAITDGEGRFSVEGLDRGPLTLSFTHPDFEPLEKDVDLSGNEEALRVTMSRGASLAGIVMREEDGSPIASATVTATAAGESMFGGALSATTSADGTFQIDAVRPGRYTVNAAAPGLRLAGGAQEVVVAAGASVPSLELRMGGGVTLTGTITGVSEDELARMSVTAFAGGMGGFGAGAPVDAGGRFELKGVSPGTVTLRAGNSFLGGRSTTKTVEIPEGAPSFDVIIEFPRGRRVEGIVTRGDQAVEGANVIFSREGMRSSSSATTDASGHYAVEGLEDGDYTINIIQLASGHSHSTRASITADRSLDIEMPLSRLAGMVSDTASGKPLANATVGLERQIPAGGRRGFGDMSQKRTDATGTFQFEGLDAGAFTLTASAEGYAVQTRSVQIIPSVEPDPVSFDLTRADGLTFRATDSRSGLPLTRLEALVLPPEAGNPLAGSTPHALFRGQLTADGSGAFHLDSLGPGAYTLVLGGQGLATRTLRGIRVPASEAAFALETGGTLEIKAESLEEGQTARALLVDGQGSAVHWQLFSADPTFTLRSDAPVTLRDLPAGSYKLQARWPGGGAAEAAVTISAGATTTMSLP